MKATTLVVSAPTKRNLLRKINKPITNKFARIRSRNADGDSPLTAVLLYNHHNIMGLTPDEIKFLIFNSNVSHKAPYWGMPAISILQKKLNPNSFKINLDDETLAYLLDNTSPEDLNPGLSVNFLYLLIESGNHLGLTEKQIDYIVFNCNNVLPPEPRHFNLLFSLSQYHFLNGNIFSDNQLKFLLSKDESIIENNGFYSLSPAAIPSFAPKTIKKINLFLDFVNTEININKQEFLKSANIHISNKKL